VSAAASGSEPEGSRGFSGKGVRLAQNMQVGPCIPVGIQLENAEVGPISGPTRRLSHFSGRGRGRGLLEAAPCRATVRHGHERARVRSGRSRLACE
jgi:hypothetical protein